MKKKVLIILGNRIRSYRLKNKMSQEELAFKAGLHRTYVGMVERGEKNITIAKLAQIAKAIPIKLSELLKDLP